MNFFNYEHPVMQVIIKVLRMIWVNLLFLLCCLPVVTAGPALCGMYFSLEKYAKQERGYAGQDFWQGFKDSFKQAFLFGLVILAIEAVLFVDIYLYRQMRELGSPLGVLAIVMVVLMVLVGLYAFFVFLYIARFRNRMKQILVNTALICIRNFKSTLLVTGILLAAGALMLFFPMTVFAAPVGAMYLVSLVMEKVYRQYFTDDQRKRQDELTPVREKRA